MGASIRQRVDDLSRETDSEVIHLRTLRKAIGWVALALPLVLVVGENVRDRMLARAGEADGVLIETSISAYFHTGMREAFVGSLCAIAVFLLCYKGYERKDEIAANVAGVAVLLVALFPTPETSREAADAGGPAPDSVTFFSDATMPDPVFVGYVHFTAATVFFVTLAIISLLLFTKSDEPRPTPRKLRRNRVYRICGVAILVCIALIGVDKLLLGGALEGAVSFTFWMETVAVVAFGVSWLVKGEAVLGDEV